MTDERYAANQNRFNLLSEILKLLAGDPSKGQVHDATVAVRGLLAEVFADVALLEDRLRLHEGESNELHRQVRDLREALRDAQARNYTLILKMLEGSR